MIASRYKVKDGYRNFPFKRKLFSRSVNYLMYRLFPIPGVYDYTIFLRAYRMRVLAEAMQYFGKFGLIQTRGSVSNTELLVKLSIFTSNILEASFVYNFEKRLDVGKINIWGTINEYFVFIFYMRRIFNKVVKYKKLHKLEVVLR